MRRRGGGSIRAFVALLTLAAAALLSGGAEAQEPSPEVGGAFLGTGIGWTMVLPEAFLGLGAFHRFGASAWGVFVDGKMTYDSPRRDPNYHRDRTVASIEAEIPSFRREFLADWDDWLLLSGGVLRSLTPSFALLVGGGMARKLVIREYLDPSGSFELSDRGVYFVEDEERSGWEPNFVFTGLMRGGGAVAFSAGAESAPRSISLGVYLVFR